MREIKPLKADRQTDGFYGAKNTTIKKQQTSSSGALSEGVEHQQESLEKAKAQELGSKGGERSAGHGIARPRLWSGTGELPAPPAPEPCARTLPSPAAGTSRCWKRLTG